MAFINKYFFENIRIHVFNHSRIIDVLIVIQIVL